MRNNLGYYIAMIAIAIISILATITLLDAATKQLEIPHSVLDILTLCLSFLMGVHFVQPPRNGAKGHE